ncbi:MAG: Hpt domain-containing protein [Candidatus Omnitrophota bacterium]
MSDPAAPEGAKKLVIDVGLNSQSLHISPEIYVRILQKAVQQTSKDLQDLGGALPLNDYEKVKAISHKLKGDYDNLRITEMSSIAKEINKLAAVGQDKERSADLINEFSHYFDQLKSFVGQQS